MLRIAAFVLGVAALVLTLFAGSAFAADESPICRYGMLATGTVEWSAEALECDRRNRKLYASMTYEEARDYRARLIELWREEHPEDFENPPPRSSRE